MQMDEKRRKGLCQHCKEKWNPTHVCKQPKLYLLHGWEDPGEEKIEKTFYDSKEVDDIGIFDLGTAPKISIHAITGTPNANTMHLEGQMKGISKVVLVD